MPSPSTPAPYVPWFSRRPGLAITGVLAMFVLITVALGDASDRLRRAERPHVEHAERDLLHRAGLIRDSAMGPLDGLADPSRR